MFYNVPPCGLSIYIIHSRISLEILDIEQFRLKSDLTIFQISKFISEVGSNRSDIDYFFRQFIQFFLIIQIICI